MSEKRFTSQRTDDYNYSDILDNGEWIGICHVDCEDDFVDKLNELHEKKEILEVQLRSATNEIDKLMSEIDMLTDTCHDCCKEIRKENNELKGLIDLFAQDICDLTELLYRNNIDYTLHSDVTNFITKWGIRNDRE